ncbi:hypothetical protein TI39_contig804g00011 [Zymoseptoria brevis]|uniref:BTB domain-containing protein n=1 Tax=Zymoseptoria brevis TaxID=1047168 RepID=A0A0F4GIY2_9PEZI|nr:hypothetical protein TI39_contig804g00011 [Zymoseptoria brevis]
MAASSQTIAIDKTTLPPDDCFKSDLIHIDVGPEDNRHTFKVHEDVLCHYSGYFKGALRGDFIEAKTKHIELATEDPEIFTIFVYGLYTRSLPPVQGDQDEQFEAICDLLIFGDARKIPLFQNDAMVLLVKTAMDKNMIPTARVKQIYASTMPDSPLRRVLIEMEALLDLVKATWTDRRTTPIAKTAIQASDYYVLDEKEKVK